MSNVDTVQEIYAAFGRGDVPAILEHLSDDVVVDGWEDNRAQAAGVPWMAERHGHAGMVEFITVVGGVGVRDLEVISLMDGGDRVAAEVVIETERYRDEEIVVFWFDPAGKVTRLRHYIDTAKHIAAATGAAAGAAA
ncbi:MAG: nuclear transport factor 2 family protein [Solirubrobacteraceae bacterium]